MGLFHGCVYMSPDRAMQEEQHTDFVRHEVFIDTYLAWSHALNIRQFTEPMDLKDLEHHMNIARREVRRVLAGRQLAPTPAELVDWSGQAYPIPRIGVLRAGRDAVVGPRGRTRQCRRQAHQAVLGW